MVFIHVTGVRFPYGLQKSYCFVSKTFFCFIDPEKIDSNPSRYIIGLTPGTLLDGVDLVYVMFDKDSAFEILYSEICQYPYYWIETLKNLLI